MVINIYLYLWVIGLLFEYGRRHFLHLCLRRGRCYDSLR